MRVIFFMYVNKLKKYILRILLWSIKFFDIDILSKEKKIT